MLFFLRGSIYIRFLPSFCVNCDCVKECTKWSLNKNLVVTLMNSFSKVCANLNQWFFFTVLSKITGKLAWKRHSSNISTMRRSVSSSDETLRIELKVRRAAEYFWRTSRWFIWWWNTVSNAWYYFSNRMILEGEIKDAKMTRFFIWFPNTHQTF